MSSPAADRLGTHASLLDANGKHALSDIVGAVAGHSHAHGEQFTGNAVLTQFTLAHTPLYGVSAYVAGVRTDVTAAGAVITFAVAPALNALVRLDYEY